jgi:hypothetical protein
MSAETKPNPAPQDAAGQVATQFVQDELAKSRTSLKRAKLTAIILLAVVGGYMGFITYFFTDFLKPKNVASLAVDTVSAQVSLYSTEISDRIREEVPKLVADLPDMLIKGMPDYREQLEAKVEEILIENLSEHSEDFGKHLDDFLGIHQAEIKELLDATGDKEKTKILMTALEQDILEYLDAETEDGETIKQKLDISLAAIQNIEKQLNRLANGKDLNAQELKTRRAVAFISKKLQGEHRPTPPPKE